MMDDQIPMLNELVVPAAENEAERDSRRNGTPVNGNNDSDQESPDNGEKSEDAKSVFEQTIEGIVDDALQRQMAVIRKEITARVIDEVRTRLGGTGRR